MKKQIYILASIQILSYVFCTFAGSDCNDIKYEIWDSNIPFPNTENIPELDAITYVRVNRAVANQTQFLHGASIICHDNVFYASWANSPVNENSGDECVNFRLSYDNGLTWSDLKNIAPDILGLRRRSHGVFFSFDNQLYIFIANFTGTDKPLAQGQIYFEDLHTEAFVWDSDNKKWQLLQTVADDFWPMDEPVKMKDGNWIVGGIDKNFKTAAALFDKDGILSWKVIKIPLPKDKFFAETSVLVDGDEVIAFMRNHSSEFTAISISNDFSKTFSTAIESNYPMAPSKPYAGMLTTGQRYLISNLDRSRRILTIAVSKKGEKKLSKVWTIRRGIPRQPIFKGWAKTPQWSYPYAYEYQGKLYVIYSIGKEDCELAIIPTKALD